MRALPPGGAVLVAIALVLTPLSAASATSAARAPSGPVTASADADADEPARVIATLDTPSPTPSPRAIAAAREEVLDDLPATSYDVVADYAHLPAVALEVDDAGLAALRDDPRVSAVQPDRPRRLFDTEADALIGAATAHSAGYTGAGTTVAVIDTGVDQAGGAVHPGLADDLVGQRCFRATDKDCPGGTPAASTAPDGGGHGTHVAGIITGPGGVAPDAGVYALKVFGDDEDDLSWDSDILDALSYVVGLNSDGSAGNDVDAVNLSLGGDTLYPTRAACAADPANQPYQEAFAALNARGVAVFAATGNDGATTGVASPACVDGAIGVGSVDDTASPHYYYGCDVVTRDGVSCFSNTTAVQGSGELVDLLAPGCEISSLGLHGATGVLACGTSMATPYAAGSAALVLQAAAGAGVARPAPADLEALLEGTGTLVRDARLSAAVRFPRVAAMDAITAMTTPLTTSISVSSPAAGASFVRGATVAASFACRDSRGGTGITSCTGTRASGAALDTTAVGTHTFVVTLRDTDGRTSQATRTYTVVPARPDGRARRAGGGRLVGDGVYGSPARQSVAGRAAPRRAVTYLVSAQNDGRAADRLRIAGGRTARGFSVRYYAPTGRLITSAVSRGAFVTPTLAPGAAYRIRVVVAATARARKARPLTTVVTLRSAASPAVTDAVRLATRRR